MLRRFGFVLCVLSFWGGVWASGCEPAPPKEAASDASAPEKAAEQGVDFEPSSFRAELPALQKPGDCKASTDPRKLLPCDLGSGIFGFWHIDSGGLPAYVYTLDHLTDKRAVYPHTSDDDRRTHFHQIGNDRVNGIAYNDGYVVLMGQERGVTFYNHFHPDHQNYAGGYSIVAEGDHAFNTAYRWKPKDAKTRRIFGLGYYQTITQVRGLRITHTILAPPGDDSLLIDHVTVENLSPVARKLRHYAYWDLNRHHASFQPIRTGTWGPRGDLARIQQNGDFRQKLSLDKGVLRASYVLQEGKTRPSRDAISKVDQYPADVFLASLGEAPKEVYTDQKAFLGKGGIGKPDGASKARAGELLKDHDALEQPAALIMRHDLSLAPGAKTSLRFAFGYLPQGKDLKMLDKYKSDKAVPMVLLQDHWSRRLAYAAAPDVPALSREVAWHAYSLLSATNYLDYYKTHVTPQGSAYLYLHGFDGAPRDQSLFSLSLAYLRPELARANLKLIMGLTLGKDGRISYSFHGHGVRENAVIHSSPSDLDLFFLLALNEYLVATGDRAFLKQQVPFHPRGAKPPPGAKGDTVLDHARAAVTHLLQEVGLGDKGLIRVGSGDWSDGVVQESGQHVENSKAHGESIPNSQMAIYVLSRFAATIASDDPALAKTATDFVAKLKQPTLDQFTGKWFLRAWLRDANNQPVALGKETINLESQPWGLLSGLLSPEQSKALATIIHDQLDKDSPIGPTLGPKGMVWPAIAQLVTWAYTRSHPQWAWEALQRQMFVAHAEKWPEQWFGIWSGADGFHSTTGLSWKSPVTPMLDWPVMNANQDGMFLLGLLRVAGVEPVDKGLQIRPLSHPKELTIDFPLLWLQRKAGSLVGEYRPHNDGSLSLILAAPQGKTLTQVTVMGKNVTLSQDKGSATVSLSLKKGEAIPFQMDWQ